MINTSGMHTVEYNTGKLKPTTSTYPLEIHFDGRVFSANLASTDPELFAGALRTIADAVMADIQHQERLEFARRMGVVTP